MEILVFLSSGLFLGWSLGANDAANVFGTAVGTGMVRFRTAATVCGVFVILGAVVSGAGAAHTLGRLGSVNALPGSFAVALASALTTFLMTRLNIPVSTSQAIVGAIIGWNLYTASLTDTSSLTRIVATWVACPLLSGTIAVLLFVAVRALIRSTRPHLLRLDAGIRFGLLAVGAFGSYSLGANNIANVMGVFVPDNPFRDLVLFGWLRVTGVQQLFLLGAVAIAVGVFTYSQRVMRTVGGGVARISPVPALVIVLAQSVTLFLFASARLEHALASRGLPTFPLVPVSSSQAVIGAIVGLSLFKGIGIRYRVLSGISAGWLATPAIAMVVSFAALFVMDAVFDQPVARPVEYRMDAAVAAELGARGIPTAGLTDLPATTDARGLRRLVIDRAGLDAAEADRVVSLMAAGRWRLEVGPDAERWGLTPARLAAVARLAGNVYDHAWQVEAALAAADPGWRRLPDEPVNRKFNKELKSQLSLLLRVSRVDARSD